MQRRDIPEICLSLRYYTTIHLEVKQVLFYMKQTNYWAVDRLSLLKTVKIWFRFTSDEPVLLFQLLDHPREVNRPYGIAAFDQIQFRLG